MAIRANQNFNPSPRPNPNRDQKPKPRPEAKVDPSSIPGYNDGMYDSEMGAEAPEARGPRKAPTFRQAAENVRNPGGQAKQRPMEKAFERARQAYESDRDFKQESIRKAIENAIAVASMNPAREHDRLSKAYALDEMRGGGPAPQWALNNFGPIKDRPEAYELEEGEPYPGAYLDLVDERDDLHGLSNEEHGWIPERDAFGRLPWLSALGKKPQTATAGGFPTTFYHRSAENAMKLDREAKEEASRGRTNEIPF